MARPGSPGRLRAGIFGTQHKLQGLSGNGESSEDELLSTQRNTRAQAKSSPIKRTRATRAETASKSSPLSRTTRSSKKTYVELSSSASEGEEAAVAKTQGKRASSVLDFGEPETSGDDVLALRSSTTKKRPRATQKPETYVELSTSEDDVPVSTKKRTKTQTPARSRQRGKHVDTETEEEDESEEDSPAPVRRRLKQRPRELDEQEQEDLNEDLDFLQSSPPRITPSARVRKPDPRKEALEALKRKRAGQSAAPSSSAATLRRDMQSIAISDDEEDYEEDDVSSVDEWAEETVAPRGARGVFREDDEDRAFIAEDDPNEPLGAPGDVDAEMPLWASNFNRMKGKELFKYAVEWMVQKKLNPAFKMDDEVYDLAFKKLDDEVRGLAGSKFKSSVWARDFMVSLEGRPEVILTEVEGSDRELLSEKCQACNRSGHPATFDIQFTGRPYHMSTLEPVEDDDGEEVDEEDDTEILGKYDSRDRDLPPASRIYHVGRFCKDNAITAHALEHWRFHLFEWVVVELEKGKHLRPSKIVERDSWSTKKRREYANKVVDGMHESGQIKRLYRDFRMEIDMAREKKVCLFSILWNVL
jgi:hypothetical protein